MAIDLCRDLDAIFLRGARRITRPTACTTSVWLLRPFRRADGAMRVLQFHGQPFDARREVHRGLISIFINKHNRFDQKISTFGEIPVDTGTQVCRRRSLGESLRRSDRPTTAPRRLIITE